MGVSLHFAVVYYLTGVLRFYSIKITQIVENKITLNVLVHFDIIKSQHCLVS